MHELDQPANQVAAVCSLNFTSYSFICLLDMIASQGQVVSSEFN